MGIERLPVPKPIREREAMGRGAGPVTTYFLSPEDLAKYRAQTKKHIHPISGKEEKPPVGYQWEVLQKKQGGAGVHL